LPEKLSSTESSRDEERELKNLSESYENQKKIISDLRVEVENKQKLLEEQVAISVMLQNKLDILAKEFEAYVKAHSQSFG